MIKSKKKQKHRTIEIDLTGEQGNAFYLLGVADNLASQLGLINEQILTEMKSGDYEHLVATFDKYFGHVVTLYR
jgi:hypothetical protein